MSVADAVPLATERIPQQVGRYVIRKFIGEGSFGRVFLADDPQLERAVALKVAKPRTKENPQRIQRFLEDARTAAQLRHPNIVPVFDAGQDGDYYYIAAALVEGQTLAETIEGLEIRRGVELIKKLAEALAYAHSHGIVHRDVKPENVMLDAKGEPHLIDFGLAKRGLELESGRKVMGTASYMSPEQAAGQSQNATAASDQYSLGVVLYEVLCGRTPFSGPSTIQLYNVVHSVPLPPRAVRPTVPRDLDEICQRATQKKPEDRYPGCRPFAEDLRRWLDGETPRVVHLTRRERFVRWVRREPKLARTTGVAALAITVAAVLGITFGIVGTVLSVKYQRAQKDANMNAISAQDSAAEAKNNANLALKRSARATFDRAFELAETGEISQGMILFAESLRQADEAGDSQLKHLILHNLANWRSRVHRLRFAFTTFVLPVGIVFPDAGKTLVVAGSDERGGYYLVFLDPTTGRETRNPIQFDRPVRVLASDPQRKLLFLAFSNGKVEMRSAANGAFLAEFVHPPGDQGLTPEIQALACGPDGCTLLTGCKDGKAYLWQRNPGPPAGGSDKQGVEFKLQRTLPHGAGRPVNAVAFHPAGRFVLTSAQVQSVGFTAGAATWWDLESPAEGVPVGNPDLPIAALAFQPAGKSFAIARGGALMGKTELWRLTLNRLDSKATVVHGHRAEVRAAAFSLDGQLLASGGQDRAVYLRDASTGERIGQPLYHPRDVRGIAFGPNGHQLATTCNDHVIRIWDIGTSEPLQSLPHGGPLFSAQANEVGTHVLTAGYEGKLWIAASSNSPTSIVQPDERIWASTWKSNGTSFYTGTEMRTNRAGAVHEWDLNGRRMGKPLLCPSPVISIAADRFGTHIAVGCNDGATLFDVRRLPAVGFPLPHPKDEIVYAVAFSPDGRFLLTGCRDKFARLWDIRTRTQVEGGQLEHPDSVLSVAFSRDGKAFVVGYAGGAQVWTWDGAKPPKRIASLPHQAAIVCVAISADGGQVLTGGGADERTIALGGAPAAIRRWDVQTQKQLGPPWLHAGMVRAASFVGIEQTILTASTDQLAGNAYLWKLLPPVEDNLDRLQTWVEVISNGKKVGDVLQPLGFDEWRERDQRLRLIEEPRIEKQIPIPRANPIPPVNEFPRSDFGPRPTPKPMDPEPKPIPPKKSAPVAELIVGSWESARAGQIFSAVSFGKDGKVAVTIDTGVRELRGPHNGTYELLGDDKISVKISVDGILKNISGPFSVAGTELSFVDDSNPTVTLVFRRKK